MNLEIIDIDKKPSETIGCVIDTTLSFRGLKIFMESSGQRDADLRNRNILVSRFHNIFADLQRNNNGDIQF